MKKIRNFILILFLNSNLSYSMNQEIPEILSLLDQGIDLIGSIETNFFKNNDLPQSQSKIDLKSIQNKAPEKSKIDTEINTLSERLESINTSIAEIEKWTEEWKKIKQGSFSENYSKESEFWVQRIQDTKNKLEKRKIKTKYHIFI